MYLKFKRKVEVSCKTQQISTLNRPYVNKKVGVAKIGMVNSVGIIHNSYSVWCVQPRRHLRLSRGITGVDLSSPLTQAIVSITILGVGEIFAGIMTQIYDAVKGKGFKEFKRMTGFKISWMMLLSALAAGPLATGLQVTAYSMAGVTYVTAICALSPVVTAILEE